VVKTAVPLQRAWVYPYVGATGPGGNKKSRWFS